VIRIRAQTIETRDIAEKPFFRKSGNNFRKNTKDRQDENIDFRMTPSPDEVDIHHCIATIASSKKVHAEIAI
jgi:hypothetical protein